MALRPPPEAADVDPLIVEVPSGTVLFRVHAPHRRATEFNAGKGDPSRFAPLRSGQPPVVVPTLYASSTIPGALSESVFHDVPYRGTAKRIFVSRLDAAVLSAVAVMKPLSVALIAGAGLRRIGVHRRDLIEGGPGTYKDTVRWAAALHDSPADPDGLAWMSRQDDTARAYVLFGDRLDDDDLMLLSPPIALAVAPGLDLVEQAASDAGITVIR